jgi:hypothetical protein
MDVVPDSFLDGCRRILAPHKMVLGALIQAAGSQAARQPDIQLEDIAIQVVVVLSELMNSLRLSSA